MSPNRDSSSTILSSSVNVPTPPFKYFQETFLYLQDQLYMILVSGSGECKMMMVKNINRRRALAMFHATDRTINEDSTEYERYHEVLELVLSDQHTIGSSFSKRYAALVECRDGLEVVLPPPPPKGAFDSLRDAFSYMKTVPPFDKYFKESNEGEQEALLYRMVDSQAVEMLLCQDPYYEKVTNQISVVGRRAEGPEIMPYSVEFHYTQKEWYERVREWLVKTFQEQVVNPKGCSSSQRPSPFGCDPDGALMRSYSDGSMVSVFRQTTSRRAKKKVPTEIKVVSAEKPRLTRPTSPTNSLISRGEISIISRGDNIWIAEKDIALGVHHGVHPDLKATTYANQVFERRVLSFYASKKRIRQSHIWVMKLMLQEELEDDEVIQLEARKGTTFWVKLSDCTDEEGKKAIPHETKWLRKADGDFIGPFVKASDSSIYKGVVEWIAALGTEQPRDPEPSPTRSFATAEKEDTQDSSTVAEEETETSLAKTSRVKKPAALTVMVPEQNFPAVFNLTGPIETLDQQAKDVCQEWINNSDTLLIKAAKKTLIDSFQGDFHSFLFLFQLQLKRIRGGYSANKQHAAQAGGVDDASWVSADPSVQEEDTRIADIERACIGFMNQMGNTMVKRYQEMTGDTGAITSPDHRDDEGVDEKAEKVNAGERQDGQKSIRKSPSHKSVPRTRRGSWEEKSRISRRDSDDPAVIDKDDTTYEKSYVSFSKSCDSSDASASTPERWLKQVYDRKGRRSPHSRQVFQNKREVPPRRGRSPRRYNEFESDEDEDETTVRSYRTRSRSYEQSFDDPSRSRLSPSPSRSFDERSPSRSFDEQSPSRSFTERSPSPDLSCSRRSRRRVYNSPPASNTFTDDDTYPTMETAHLDSVSLAGSETSIEQALSDEKPPKEAGWFGSGWL